MSLLQLLSGPDPVVIARQLIGAEVITGFGATETALRITETEAYFAPDDRASHAHGNKRTKRTEVFYHAPGTAYVYLCYGIHEMFNVVTGPAGMPHAILIRAGEPSRGVDLIRERRKLTGLTPRLSSGPGVVTKALAIDRRQNGDNLLDPKNLVRLEMPAPPLLPEDILATPRIGIDYAGEPWVSKPWRFIRRGTAFVSGPKSLNET